VPEQVAGNSQATDPHLAKYLEKVQTMAVDFEEFGLVHVDDFLRQVHRVCQK